MQSTELMHKSGWMEWMEWYFREGFPESKTTCLTWFPHLMSSWFIQVESNEQLAKNKRTDVWMHLKIGGTLQTFPRVSVSNAAFLRIGGESRALRPTHMAHMFVVHRFHRPGIAEVHASYISSMLVLSGLTLSPTISWWLRCFFFSNQWVNQEL